MCFLLNFFGCVSYSSFWLCFLLNFLGCVSYSTFGVVFPTHKISCFLLNFLPVSYSQNSPFPTQVFFMAFSPLQSGFISVFKVFPTRFLLVSYSFPTQFKKRLEFIWLLICLYKKSRNPIPFRSFIIVHAYLEVMV